MGISFENLFMPNKSIQNTQTGGVQTGTQSVNGAVNQMLQNMFSKGDVFSGKVISLQGNVVELLLPGGQNISALLGQNVQVSAGEQMMFAVKSMNVNQMELNPLFMNTANTTTIMKALDGAGMAVNESNVTMVQNMVERGMSIQKDALLSMKRSVAQFPSAPIEDVVTLQAMKMPVTEENLNQLAAYKNSENQIMKPIMEMISEMPNAFESLMNSGETGKAVALYKDFIHLVSEMPETINGAKDGGNSPMDLGKTEITSGAGENVAAQNTYLTKDGQNLTEAVKHVLTQFGVENEVIEAVLKDNTDLQVVIKLLSSKISENSGFSEERLAEIFKDPVFKLVMKEAAKETATITPKEVANSENIDKLYDHLMERADKILETLSGKEDMAIAKGAQNLKVNVDFMNQMNQMFQYIQLPLKFAESNANGELYVYGNGKKLSLEDGSISALLHLDLEHLGTVDIHVEMNADKQVNTNFYFEEEAMLDFVYEHIDMLNERLEKRGYGPITKVQMRDDTTKTPMEAIFDKKEETPILLKTQAFDARI